MSITAFSIRTRSAGDLNENKLNASFRSTNRFDQLLQAKANHLSREDEKLSLITKPPTPEPTSERKKERRSKRREKTSDEKEPAGPNDEERSASRRNARRIHRNRSKEESGHGNDAFLDDEQQPKQVKKEKSDETKKKSHSKEEVKRGDEDIKESLKNLTEKQRRRRNRHVKYDNDDETQMNDENRQPVSTTSDMFMFKSESSVDFNQMMKPVQEGEFTKKLPPQAPSQPHIPVSTQRVGERKSSIVKMNAFEKFESNSMRNLAGDTTSLSGRRPSSAGMGIESECEDEIRVDLANNDPALFKLKPIHDEKFLNVLFKSRSSLEFILTPPPQGQIVNCRIVCRKGLFTDYYFYLELPTFVKSSNPNKLKLLMKAYRRVASAKSYYLIDAATNTEDVVETTSNNQTETTVGLQTTENTNNQSGLNCARIVSNINRKKFKLDLNKSSMSHLERNILNIQFKSTLNEPRKICADAFLCSGNAINAEQNKVTYFLKNRQPYFDMVKKRFVLKYNGRAKLSSKNNFQIVDESSPDDIIMQLGKVETCIYNCDYAFPLCAVQAFGFAMASFCR
jgi:tubby-related protein 1